MHIANANELQSQQQNDDSVLMVRFFVKAHEDQQATKEQGRPVFTDREFIEIRTPGKKDAVCRPARQRDIDRFPRHYEAFKARTDVSLETGTPLAEWPQVTRSMAEELAFFNVKTVEQLAACPDSQLINFMGGGMLKEKAKRWLEEAAGENVRINDLETELAKRDEEINELKAAVAALQAAAKPAVKKAPVKKKTKRKKVTAKKE